MPFVTAGDPDLEFTAAVLEEFVAPRLQLVRSRHSVQRSDCRWANHSRIVHPGTGPKNQAGAKSSQCLSGVAPKLSTPLVTMVSYAIVYRHGLEQYVADTQRAGVAGVIVPDLLVEEAAPLAKICRQADFSLIQLVTPTTPRERALRIAESSTGFIYYVSVTGHYRRANRTAAGTDRQRRLAARANAVADVHWVWHQHAGTCAAAGAGGRRIDCRLGDRSPHCRSRDEAARRGARRRGRLRGVAARGAELNRRTFRIDNFVRFAGATVPSLQIRNRGFQFCAARKPEQ